jgi:hypothetical protein
MLDNMAAKTCSSAVRAMKSRGLVALTAALLGIGWAGGVDAQNANLSATPQSGDIPVFTERYDPAEFCADGSGDGPCDVAPVDVPEFDASFVYRFLAYHAQRPFDRFSWQAFTALMSPRRPSDVASPKAVWEGFPTKRDVFKTVALPNQACAADLPEGHLLLASYVQSSGDILIDQAGNFVLFETRINPAAANYIRDNGLDHANGRAGFAASGQEISFPVGQLGHVINSSPVASVDGAASSIPHAAPGEMGAQTLKFAWRILPDTDAAHEASYYTKPARIALVADQTLDGKPTCLDVTVGLVGLHIVQRVASGNGDRWIWASFEHVDNVPLAANARRPNSIITDDPFPVGCLAPMDQTGDFAFFGGKTANGKAANQALAQDVKWAADAPYARTVDGDVVVGPDIVRCWRLFSGTAETNFVWQDKLSDTIWQNYMLLGTQWIGNPGGAPFGVGEVPRFLTNSTLESFTQHHSDATCLGCHNSATTDAGQNANFTFLLDPDM